MIDNANFSYPFFKFTNVTCLDSICLLTSSLFEHIWPQRQQYQALLWGSLKQLLWTYSIFIKILMIQVTQNILILLLLKVYNLLMYLFHVQSQWMSSFGWSITNVTVEFREINMFCINVSLYVSFSLWRFTTNVTVPTIGNIFETLSFDKVFKFTLWESFLSFYNLHKIF